MKTGLVLEGGGMRGMYTAGVLDVMMENDVFVDRCVGVSAGAVFGCNYKSRQIGRTIRYNTKYCADPRFMSMRSLIKTGDLFDEEFCYHTIPNELDPFDTKTYKENPMEFFVVCTDVNTGKAVYHRCDNGDAEDIEWMRASASLPFVSRIVKIDSYELLDGGVADSIPIEWMRENGFIKNIVILTRNKDYRKTKNKFTSIMGLKYKKYPELIRDMKNRHIQYNKTLDKIETLEKCKEILVIRPSEKVEIDRTEKNPERLRALYNLGRKDALDKLKEIKAFID